MYYTKVSEGMGYQSPRNNRLWDQTLKDADSCMDAVNFWWFDVNVKMSSG